MLSVLMPVFDERNTVREAVERVLKIDEVRELIVVDDGSTDGSSGVLEEMRSDRVRILRHENNLGKGAAIRTALEYATGEISIIQDADLEYNPADYIRLIEPIRRGAADAVFGSRVLGGMKHVYPLYCWGGHMISLVARMLYGCSLTDITTGYKAVVTRVLKDMDLQCAGFSICAEVTAKLCKGGYRIVEVPIAYKPRTFREGKKIRMTAGLGAVYVLAAYRLTRCRTISGKRATPPCL